MIKERKHGFWMGIGFWIGFSMAHQDYLGLDRYIELLRAQWIELPWWCGAIGAVLCLLGMMAPPIKEE